MLVLEDELVASLVPKVLKRGGQRIDATNRVKGAKCEMIEKDRIGFGGQCAQQVHNGDAGGTPGCESGMIYETAAPLATHPSKRPQSRLASRATMGWMWMPPDGVLMYNATSVIVLVSTPC